MDSRAIKDFYRAAFKEYGDTPEGMRWGDRATHLKRLLRMDKLIMALDIRIRSILDVGCGIGMLYEVWGLRYTGIDYVGVDLVPEYVDIARETLHAQQKISGSSAVYCGDFLDLPLEHPFSATVAVGTFAWVDGDIVRKMLTRMWELTADGGVMAFTYIPENPLSDFEVRHMGHAIAQEMIVYGGYSNRLNEQMVVMKKANFPQHLYLHREEIEDEILRGEHRDEEE